MPDEHSLLPARSRLYHLAPLGVGTPATESLTGYVARLAEAHGVRVGVLMAQEIGARCRDPGLARGVRANCWTNYSRAMNGGTVTARALVATLEELTGRRDLRFLTMLPWANVVSAFGLLRVTRAWCPACYGEWRATGQVVYEPLLWTLVVVATCPRHGQELCTHCPQCRRSHYPLAPGARPGYCSRCGQWLGTGAASCGTLRSTGLTDAVGALIAVALTLPACPAAGQIARAIDRHIAGHPGGRVAVARVTGLPAPLLSQWRRDRRRPALCLLLRFCATQNLSLPQLLTEPPSATAPRAQVPLGRDKRARPHRADEAACRLRRAVAAAVPDDEEPPPSLRQVACRVGRPVSTLRRGCPDLCAQIAARWRAYRHTRRREREERIRRDVRCAVLQIHAQGLYPSTQRVGARLAAPGYLRAGFAAQAWREALQEVGLRA